MMRRMRSSPRIIRKAPWKSLLNTARCPISIGDGPFVFSALLLPLKIPAGGKSAPLPWEPWFLHSLL